MSDLTPPVIRDGTSPRSCAQCGTHLAGSISSCPRCGAPAGAPPTLPPPAPIVSPAAVPTAVLTAQAAGASPPPPPPVAGAYPGAHQGPPRKRRPSNAMIAVVLFCVAGLVAALVIAVTGNDDKPSARLPGPTTTTVEDTTGTDSSSSPGGEVLLDPLLLGAGEVLLEPVGVDLADSFSDSVTMGVEAAPAVVLPSLPIPTTTAPLPDNQVALAQVAGNQPGLYGGTRDVTACDKLQMINFLEDSPAKAAAWAGVQGIDVSTIRGYIGHLTPVVLTKDTRVTNHGFRDGRAYAHPSVLQAGHAVLVDEYGVPRAKCSCGNPLLPTQPLKTKPVYVGATWPGFSSVTVITVIATVVVVEGFVIIDLTDGSMIVRPVGFDTGSTDTPLAIDRVCDLFPTDPACTTPQPTVAPTTTPPVTVPVEPGVLIDIGNIGAIVPGATSAPSFTVTTQTLITSIQTYHYGATSAPGQLGLQAGDGSFYGPFAAIGLDGQGGVPNAYWVAKPNVVIPPGTYSVWDSSPATWSTNSQAGMVGFAVVMGAPTADPSTVPVAPPAPTTTAPPATDPSSSVREAALTIIDQTLLDCGYNVTDWIDGGPLAFGWEWSAVIGGVTRTFLVNDPLADFWIDTINQPSSDIAVECGFYQP